MTARVGGRENARHQTGVATITSAPRSRCNRLRWTVLKYGHKEGHFVVGVPCCPSLGLGPIVRLDGKIREVTFFKPKIN
jgi:hypothetical protein